MSKVTASADFDRVPKEELNRFLSLFGEQVISCINNGLNIADNFESAPALTDLDGQILTCVVPVANQDNSYSHSLGRVPTGYILCGATAAMSIYDSTIANTRTSFNFRASATGTARIFVF
jgi:hypothetical protein